MFWVEVIIAATLAFLAVRADRSDLIAPLILGVVVFLAIGVWAVIAANATLPDV